LVLSPTGSINLGFTTEGRLAVVLVIPSLGVPNWSVIYINTAPSISFLAPLPRRKKTSARGVSHAQSFTLFLFCFILFLLASFYKKYKKISFYFNLLFMSSVVAVTMSPEQIIFTFKQKSEESFKEAWSRIYD
jgi:hypothetical protein